MKIMNLTQQLHQLDKDLTIYAKKPWNCDTEVELLYEPDDGEAPNDITPGYECFLEIFIAQEVIPDLSHVEPSFTLEQWCERLIDYQKMMHNKSFKIASRKLRTATSLIAQPVNSNVNVPNRQRSSQSKIDDFS